MPQKRNKRGQILSKVFHQIDLFPQDMSFRENGGDSFKTTCGALLSFVLIMMIGLYSVQKYLILVERDDTLISEFS